MIVEKIERRILYRHHDVTDQEILDMATRANTDGFQLIDVNDEDHNGRRVLTFEKVVNRYKIHTPRGWQK